MKALSAKYLLPMTGKAIEEGLVVIDEGKIVDCGGKEKLLARYSSLEVEEFSQSVLLPGLVNAHTHLDLLFFNSPSTDFFERLIAGWNFRKNLNLTDRRHSLEEGIRQLLRSGTTSVGDAGHYAGLLPQAVRGPMRMVLFPELLSGGDPTIHDNYEAALSQVDEITAANSKTVTAGIAPYAAYTLSRHLLKIIAQQSREVRIPLKIHVAETFSEMQFFYESKGEIAEKLFPQMGWTAELPPPHRKTPIQYLDSIGFLKDGPTLIGCNHLADPDLQLLAKTGSKIVHSPRANTHLKLGRPPLKKLRASGIPVALGTDGIASLHSLSLWDEMRFIQKNYKKEGIPNPQDLLKMATLDGARALGLQDRIGSIEPGKEADLIAVKLAKGTSLKDLPEWLISHVTEKEIVAVFVEGKRVKSS